jgi:N6-L-threonylcarbamoyladenine synthase
LAPAAHSGNLDFSFAGLRKPLLTTQAKKSSARRKPETDLAASTQAAIVEVLVKKSMAAMQQTGLKRLVVAG